MDSPEIAIYYLFYFFILNGTKYLVCVRRQEKILMIQKLTFRAEHWGNSLWMLMRLMTIQEVLYWSTDLCDGDYEALGINSISNIVA